MEFRFKTEYLNILNGDVKASLMFAFSVAQQKKLNEKLGASGKSDKFGNYWAMTAEEWDTLLCVGQRRSQMKIRNHLKNCLPEIWKERDWGKPWPKHKEFCIDLEKLNQLLDETEGTNED